MIAFGPVPSRRLGRSLGINNIPPKLCTYSCVYCQLGRTPRMQVERQTFYKPERIVRAVRDKVEGAREAGEAIDYLTFVPDGEPTLDINLGCEIELLKLLRVKIAVITNGSLIWREGVREALMKADWVSLKVDSVREDVWRRVDRPYGALRLGLILRGALTFAREFEGQLVTETMLVEGLNDGSDHIREVADFLAELRPAAALFLRFQGPDYDGDDDAGVKLDAYVRWVQRVLDRYAGSLIDITLGDKGSYLYAAFGAPIAKEDDSRRAVAAALALRTPPGDLDFIQPPQIGISQGVMRTGAYGGTTRRTYGVLGDEVNMSARLMQYAQAGEVIVNQRAQRYVAEDFVWELLPAIKVKGK